MVSTPLKKCEFVSLDDEIPNVWKHKIDVPNHQSVCNLYNLCKFDYITFTGINMNQPLNGHRKPVEVGLMTSFATQDTMVYRINGLFMKYPLVMTNSLLLKIAIEIGDFLPLKMVDLSIVMWLFTRG